MGNCEKGEVLGTQLNYFILCVCIWSRYYLSCECSQWCVFLFLILCTFYADFASTRGAIYCVWIFKFSPPTNWQTYINRLGQVSETNIWSNGWRTFNFCWPFGEHVFLFHLLTVRTNTTLCRKSLFINQLFFSLYSSSFGSLLLLSNFSLSLVWDPCHGPCHIHLSLVG